MKDNNSKEFLFFEKNNAIENIFRKKLKIQANIESNIPTKILRYLPFTKKLKSKSIFHSSYYRFSLQRDIVNVTTVHDFTYEYFVKGLPRHLHFIQKSLAIKNSSGIICISNSTKKDLLKFYPDIDESIVKVIYNGVSEDFRIIDDRVHYLERVFPSLIGKKYILYVGDRSLYKNFDIAVAVVKELKDYFLVAVGGKNFRKDELEKIRPIKDRFYYFGGIDSKKLNILYNNAFCLLYPSSYEGFGIPIIEAMRAGCPVVSTNRSSIPEISGNAALLVDNIDVDSFVREVLKLEDNNFRAILITKGLENSSKYSWDKCFAETYDFYTYIYNKKFGG